MSPYVLFLFAILVSIPTLNAQDVVKSTCDQTLYKDTCATTLSKTSAKDVKGLATDAMGAVLTVGEESLKRIDSAKATANGAILDHLNTCSDIYVSANGHASEAVKSLEAGKTDSAIIQVSAAMRVQRSCDDGFKKDNLKNPVDDLHSKWVKQANVALTICTLANPTGGYVPLA